MTNSELCEAVRGLPDDDRGDGEMKRFVARYYWDESWWHLDIFAKDWADAESRCKRLNIQLDGEYVLSYRDFPGAQFIANVIIGVRNVLKGEK